MPTDVTITPKQVPAMKTKYRCIRDRDSGAGFDFGAGEADSFGTAVPSLTCYPDNPGALATEHRPPPPITGVQAAPARTALARTSLLCQPAVPSIAPNPSPPAPYQPTASRNSKTRQNQPLRRQQKQSNLLASTPTPLDSRGIM